MRYPIFSYNDGTEVTASKPDENGNVLLHVEKFDESKDEFINATFVLPTMELKSSDGYTEQELESMKNKYSEIQDDILSYIKENHMYTPEVVQVIPHDNYIVEVLFQDGKIVHYDVNHLLEKGIFTRLKDKEFYKTRCTVMNHTLAWDVSGEYDPTDCIDIDPYILYSLQPIQQY